MTVRWGRERLRPRTEAASVISIALRTLISRAIFRCGFVKIDGTPIDNERGQQLKLAERQVPPLVGRKATGGAFEEGRVCRKEDRMSKKYSSVPMAAIHETMKALRDVGAVGKRTMRHFDEACLTPIWPLNPKAIGAICEKDASAAPFSPTT